MGLNNETPIKYDLIFIGRANPGRSNAYAFSTSMEMLHQEYAEFRIVLELNTNIGGFDDQIGYLRLQITNTKVSGVGTIVTLRNALERHREASLRLLDDTLKAFKRENYTQENWDEIHDIYRTARAYLNKSIDSETITISIEQAIDDFLKVPTID